jgi:hypothetical protein
VGGDAVINIIGMLRRLDNTNNVTVLSISLKSLLLRDASSLKIDTNVAG